MIGTAKANNTPKVTPNIPDYILDTLDLSTLRPMSESYVSADLKKILSDVVYSCKRKDHKGDAGISLLLEHKSAPDKYTPSDRELSVLWIQTASQARRDTAVSHSADFVLSWKRSVGIPDNEYIIRRNGAESRR